MPCGVFDFAELAGEIRRRTRDRDDADGGAVVDDGLVELGDRDVEVLAELVLERADDLAAVFEGVRVFDGEFESESGDGHKAADSG